ncbi:MAG: DUF1844 domain-containing protein [Ignavibacteriaceae bacterium]|jgi:hypothetical protein|nr:DUF1844 domain-containing protein [Ignavibacteriaceae bacterium]
MTETTNHEVLFMQLIMQQQQWAMMSMGKLKNPMSDKIERNLEMSKYAIDTLDMLAAKTKGNLGEYENKFISEVLRELKLNYVEEVEKDKKEESASPAATAGEEKPPVA